MGQIMMVMLKTSSLLMLVAIMSYVHGPWAEFQFWVLGLSGSKLLCFKPGFHYRSSRAKLTARELGYIF